MGLLTNWGYEIGADTLADMLTAEEFNAFTANKFAGDARISPNIKAASLAIRNYCGWHLYPSLACRMETSLLDRRVAFVGRDIIIQLPARYVSGITAVTLDGAEHTVFTSETNGTLRLHDVPACMRRYSALVVEYAAGLPDGLMDAVKELTAYRVTHALSSSYGVMSEAAGGVSITYNAAWAGNSRSTALPDDNKEALAPYRLEGVF